MNVSCEELVGRKYFRSYSEFYFALCMAAVCKIHGCQLDMSSMRIDSGILPDKEVAYFKYLVSTGAIALSEDVEKTPWTGELPLLYMDMSLIEERKDILVEETVDSYIWSFEWALPRYKNQSLCYLSKMGNVILHIVAYMLYRMGIGEIPKKRLVIEISKFKAMTTHFYINLMSCERTISWFPSIITLNVDLSSVTVDISYSIFCNNSIAAKRNKMWTISEKRNFMEKEGIVEGSIVVLWERKGVCVSNPAGRLTGSSIVRVNEILKDRISVTSIALNKTKEELVDDYESIPENRRYLFGDMLYSKPDVRDRMLSLYDLGIQDYFLNEAELLVRLDEYEKVIKKITVQGVTDYVEMREVDAIYWLLCQYDIDFDDVLYKKMYNKGQNLMWDEYGEDYP